MKLLRRRSTAHPSRQPVDGAPAVACHGLTKRFGPIVAVDDASLEVVRGEIVALLGPSGCGKTTFLRLVAGFERPDAGTIVLAGHQVASPGRLVGPERRRVGVVFQDYALFPHLCVGDNVAYGLSGPDCDERVREALNLVGLVGMSARSPHELSGGQQQRVALARALAPEPDVILLDEPFSNLDAALRARVREEIRDILRRVGTTAIFVTHDQEEALSLADRVAIMRDGRIHQVDTPERIYTRPSDAFVAAFVGGANLIGGSSDGEAVSCGLGTIHPLNAPPPGPVTLVVRPESLRIRYDARGDSEVVATTYYGHDQLIEVRLPNRETVNVRLFTARFFEAGDRVVVSVVPDEVLAFPA